MTYLSKRVTPESHTVDITPQPTILEATRQTGYKYYQAVNELIDNSKDADAKNVIIEIGSKTHTNGEKYPYLTIADNGCGMSLNRLKNYLSLGVQMTSPTKSHGRFGVGGKTSIGTFLGDATIYSTNNLSEGLYKIKYNIDEIIKSGKFETIASLVDDPDEVKDFLNFTHTDGNTSGTVIKIENIKAFKFHSVSQVKNTILKSAGETYRLPLLSKSFTITINRQEVDPTDPMFLKVPLEKKYGEVLDKKTHDVTWVDENGKERESSFTITYVKVPEPIEKGSDNPIRTSNSGVWVMRNNRQIISSTRFKNLPGTISYVSVSLACRFRALVEFNDDLDWYFNLNVWKTEVRPCEAFFNQIRNDFIRWKNKVMNDAKLKNMKKPVSNKVRNNYGKKFQKHIQNQKGLLTLLPSAAHNSDRVRNQVSVDNMFDVTYVPSIIGGVPWRSYNCQAQLNGGGSKLQLEINESHPYYETFLRNADDNTLAHAYSLMVSLSYGLWDWVGRKDTGDHDKHVKEMNMIESVISQNLITILQDIPMDKHNDSQTELFEEKDQKLLKKAC